MNFSLEQLNTFVAVFEQQAFSKAAIKLNKHRTTVAQVITNLEDQLAITLFERLSRTVEPTEDAILLYHYAKQILEQAKTFDSFALSLSYGGLESVTIAYASFLPHHVVTSIRRQLDEDFPSMRVNFLVRTKPEIKAGIEDGSIHFGIVNIYESKVINSIDFTFLGNMPFVPFAHVGSKLSSVESAQTLSLMKSSRQLILKSLVDDKMTEKVLLSSKHEYVEQLAVIIKLVQEGFGWALLPKSITASEYVTENLVPIQCDELKQEIMVPIALWCPHSKQIAQVKKSIVKVADYYIQRSISELSK
ncbi:LysR family transcriptional regulator [Vibrio sp. YMD68]|uniref:LysR family transcriptional regulator n=1 Tax=Vibrio sp. YMD68 TaxID=3042300 RepID=UPI002499DB38|nr:LysR family transcriptional regulator [Vibrio sp. YMD68]WGV98663.1 LysR family transcriptional regulator [Vibrio sp. YMD68]